MSRKKIGFLAFLALLPVGNGCMDIPVPSVCAGGIICPPHLQCAAAQAICIAGPCGDGITDDAVGETCDDGNVLSGDGCSPDCLIEETCGDGAVTGGEECDDGNLVSGDGCSPECMIEEICGDGAVIGREECDDGNLVSGDGCSPECIFEETCGDGAVTGGEECDATPCPGDLASYRGSNGTEVSCHCSSSATASGTVWGTGMYKDDSALCRAAVHAGVVPVAGGIVHAVIAAGVSIYSASTRNGITSGYYFSGPGSYYFPCPGDLTRYRGSNGTEVSCHCSSSATAGGTVWGTAMYTDDSALCRAAVHAGVVPLAGGTVHAVMAAGVSSYGASTRNGVTTRSYGNWPGSYYFPCPGNLTSYRGRNGTEVSCHCSSSATAGGTVWGTDMYTDDSALCRAAVHAGEVPLAGGIVRAVIAAGVSSYSGSTRNGVTSLSYGTWPGSYYFP
jgi:cysteine-rich repeat protein